MKEFQSVWAVNVNGGKRLGYSDCWIVLAASMQEALAKCAEEQGAWPLAPIECKLLDGCVHTWLKANWANLIQEWPPDLQMNPESVEALNIIATTNGWV